MLEELKELSEFIGEKTIYSEDEDITTEIAIIHLSNDSYLFFQLFESLSKIVSSIRMEFNLNEQTLELRGMDASRISLYQINLKDIDVYKNGVFDIDIDDFVKILNVNKTESNKLEFIISFLPLGINIREIGNRSPKRKKIAKTYSKDFEYITINEISEDEVEFFIKYSGDVETEDIPMDNLLSIKFPSTITIDVSHYLYILYNSSIYSEIINFKFDFEDGVKFTESGQIGDQEILLPLEDLVSHNIEESTSGAYSLTFLKSYGKMLNAMVYESEEDYNIIFSLKTDHPLYMNFKGSFLNFDAKVFLAPRIEEADFDDDDMDEF
jgi:hypothetical protein